MIYLLVNCLSIEYIKILFEFLDDEMAIFIVEVRHRVRGLAKFVFCSAHQVVELFLYLIRT